MKRSNWFPVIGLVSTWAAYTPAIRADLFHDLATGLGYAGFNIEGQHNFLSGGEDFLLNTNFRGNPIDYGIGDLSLSGPVSLQVNAGRRGLSTLDISLTTALGGDVAATPLLYSLTADAGAQTTRIDGSILMDADLSINGFGFYDLNLTYSSRQNVTNDGRVSNDSTMHDFDVGPINISGNIFADALAVLTDPIFKSQGQINPFASFSGNAQLAEILRGADPQAQQQIADGGRAIVDSILTSVLPTAGSSGAKGATFPSFHGANANSVVPEPAVVIFMLLGVPFIFAHLLSRRRTVANDTAS